MMPLFTPLNGVNFEQVFSAPLSQEKQHDIIGVSLAAIYSLFLILIKKLRYDFDMLRLNARFLSEIVDLGDRP
jgi:hypothetical protein